MKLREDNIFKSLVVTIAAATLFYSPRFWDPTVFPKFALLTLGLIPLLILTLVQLRRNYLRSVPKNLLLLVILLAVFPLISAISSEDYYTALFGITTRYNGLLAWYSSLASLLIAYFSFQIKSLSFLFRVLILLFCSQIVLGIFQDRGFLLVKANNPYSPLIGTFSNPNFYSAFLGFALSTFVFLLFYKRSLKIRFFCLLINLAIALLLFKSQSIQGLFMGFFSLIFFLTIRILILRKKALSIFWFSSVLSTGLLVLFGVFGNGPLREMLFQPSTLYRVDYWRAALRMLRENLFFGVGPDQFQYFYTRYRDSASVRRELNVITDSAHSYFLQAGATMGILFLSAFLILYIYITYMAVRKSFLLRSTNLNLDDWVVSLWLGFVLQAMISVENVVLISWGFLFGGIILSRIKPIGVRGAGKGSNKESRRISVRLKSGEAYSLVSSLIVSLVLISFPFHQLSFLSQLRDKSISNPQEPSLDEIQEELKVPDIFGHGDRYVWSRIVEILYRSGRNNDTIFLLKQLESEFPTDITLLDYQAQFYANNKDIESSISYREKIYNLDPYNLVNIENLVKQYKEIGNKTQFVKYLEIGKSIDYKLFESPDYEFVTEK